MEKLNLAGVVVLYNPTDKTYQNINSYIDYIDTLFVIDNSDSPNSEFVISKIINMKKVIYLNNNENLGIAKALNIAVDLANSMGFKYLLTMDQDSYFYLDSIKELIDFLLNNNHVALVSPYHGISHVIPDIKENYIEESLVMTSGNIINIDICKLVSGFDEKLFIDHVDHDFCLKLKKNGYKIFRVNKSILIHNLGNLVKVKVFNKEIDYRFHNFIREYYIYRNGLYIYNKYKNVFPVESNIIKNQIIDKFIRTMIFDRHRFKKLLFITKGILDSYRGKFGKYVI